MEDYIDALLQLVGERRMTSVSCRYQSALVREEAACDALCQTLSEEQHDLFLAYESARGTTAATIAEDEYARAAFLLAKEIFS